MDTGLLNLGEEHFSFNVFEDVCNIEFEPFSSLPNDHFQYGHEDSVSLDGHKPYFPDWDNEREINGDIALLPLVSTSFCETMQDESPPSDYLHKMDWSTLIDVDDFGHETPIPAHTNHDEANPAASSIPLDNEIKDFDLAKYIEETSPRPKIKAGMKKIDLEAQRYIVEEDDEEPEFAKIDPADQSDDLIDVESISEGVNLPVLEATDEFSLLEQFEASEKPNLTIHQDDKSFSYGFGSLMNSMDLDVGKISASPIEIFERIPNAPIDIFEEVKPPKLRVEIEAKKPKAAVKKDTVKKAPGVKPVDGALPAKNKLIRDALPQELIARINESGKRQNAKTITVIAPIPNKKRAAARPPLEPAPRKMPKLAPAPQCVQLDHDYCSTTTPYPKDPKKDSGFQSSEEDDRSILRNQPTVKNADGKLMVSLLKCNTIRNNQKKKLNLEEYKKRRLIKLSPASASSSPLSSSCSSPLPEDENLKRQKHLEKLNKMADELLKSAPKSAVKPVTGESPVKEVPPAVAVVVPAPIMPPPDLEVKTYVSIGCNTDVTYIAENKKNHVSDVQLEEIRPLLQKVSDKINSNSFITSLIENIPKVNASSNVKISRVSGDEVREDKIIQYLKKDRPVAVTKVIGVQTDFDMMEEEPRYRRRIDGRRSSSSSTVRSSSSSDYCRGRSSSRLSRSSRRSDSYSSSSSSSGASSRSRSRSRSHSPNGKSSNSERLREVEERRVVYVGRLPKGTVKEDLRKRFKRFGRITNISIHFRQFGENYGFVTYAKKEDAYEAVEHGNDHAYHKFDLSFGGRRIFCQTTYADLDKMNEEEYNYHVGRASENSFDALLRVAKENVRRRKS